MYILQFEGCLFKNQGTYLETRKEKMWNMKREKEAYVKKKGSKQLKQMSECM